ncbi:hypothetical protein ASPWEDRAFT_174119 [Aspergillus wentii DTO 134E9]|uniref:ShKT domain-containing protein n=1 Tax=Aspergillus wentii DTO 134E9 TaxID=1073089 RepID=A0A1L9RCM6_ASPWE|nr:uncharacterized protein ASPWEDRAFT_174119 [Aspergillus wentii DTO 134E9]KAI9924252.1 hypothetical protein MW887_007202 [Aspergillus wentii]OJJ32670.1 hypothetical protein ASPWEDRAFT_174119 [Aspergillus wentii DTO 134E9]
MQFNVIATVFTLLLSSQTVIAAPAAEPAALEARSCPGGNYNQCYLQTVSSCTPPCQTCLGTCQQSATATCTKLCS